MNLNNFKLCCQLSFLIAFLFLQLSKANSQNIQFTPEEQQWIKEHPAIKFGYEPRWPPFEIYENGEYKGIIGDYVKIFEKEIGIEINPIPDISWEETIAGLKSGTVDITMCAGITEDRKEYLNFTAPYISSSVVIITRKGGDFVSNLSDLEGKRVSLPEDYYTVEMIKRDYPKIVIDYQPGIEDAIRAVSMRESEAFVGSLVVASYYIEHMGYSNLRIAAPTDYKKVQIGVAARKDWPELIGIVQKVLDNISFEEKNAILQKWMAVRYEYGLNMAKIKKYALYSGLTISIIFVIILLWNKSLQREIKKRGVIEEKLELALINTNKKSEERKTLLQEIHHRVKNNLQIIISLLRLQSSDEDKELSKKLQETISRINAISIVHEKVYLSENVANINLEEYIRSLTQEVISSFNFQVPPTFKVISNFGEVELKSLIPMALILNELITNSLKYGFNKIENGEILITINQVGGETLMTYYDNGIWITPSAESKTFGHTLMEVFSEELGGIYNRVIDKGTTYNFVFTKVLKTV